MTETPAPTRHPVLLIGSGHWGNPGQDLLSTTFDDMLAPGRQREIADCIARLAAFGPTKVALEVSDERTNRLQDEYRRYREGRLTLTADERHQLGLRLAAACGHDRIHGIDWHDLDRPIGWDVAMAFAQEHGQQDLIPFWDMTDQQIAERNTADTKRVQSMRVTEMILDAHQAVHLAESHKVYADMTMIGEGDTYIGADVILRWYERNMKIFVNLTRIITSPEDRVAIVIGAGHVPLLTHFIEASGRFDLESPVTYLREGAQ